MWNPKRARHQLDDPVSARQLHINSRCETAPPVLTPLFPSCQSLPSHLSFTRNQPLHPSGSDTPGLSTTPDWTLFSPLLFLFSPLWRRAGRERRLAISPRTSRRCAMERRWNKKNASLSGGVFPQRLLESLQSSLLKTRSKRAMKVDRSLYLEVASGHFLLGEDDSRATTTNRRSAYGGMAMFVHSKLPSLEANIKLFCQVPSLVSNEVNAFTSHCHCCCLWFPGKVVITV